MFYVWSYDPEKKIGTVHYFASNQNRAVWFVRRLVAEHCVQTGSKAHFSDPNQTELNLYSGITHTADGHSFGYDPVVADCLFECPHWK